MVSGGHYTLDPIKVQVSDFVLEWYNAAWNRFAASLAEEVCTPMTRPNIVYIHSHDTGRYVQPYGCAVSTPNIQRIAEEGVLFRQCFCAGPTCSPSRAALLTGLAATALSYRRVEATASDWTDPSWPSRWAGLLGIVDTATATGLLLALATARRAAAAPAPQVAEGLTGPAYVVLAAIGVLLVAGLCWCFYRALSADRNLITVSIENR